MPMTVEKAQEYGWKDRSAAFAAWWNKVNAACYLMSGCTLDDLPDYDFANAFTEGMKPKETAEDVLAEAGFEDLDF